MRGALGYTGTRAAMQWALSPVARTPFTSRFPAVSVSRLMGAHKRQLATVASPEMLAVLNTKHPRNNVGEAVKAKVGRNLHLLPNHPLNIIKTK